VRLRHNNNHCSYQWCWWSWWWCWWQLTRTVTLHTHCAGTSVQFRCALVVNLSYRNESTSLDGCECVPYCLLMAVSVYHIVSKWLWVCTISSLDDWVCTTLCVCRHVAEVASDVPWSVITWRLAAISHWRIRMSSLSAVSWWLLYLYFLSNYSHPYSFVHY